MVVLVVAGGALVVLQMQGIVSLPVLENVLPAGTQEGEEPAYESISLARGTIASTVSATGNIKPEAEISLSFDTAGRVTQVLVTEGQSVRQGQLLAELDVNAHLLSRDEALVTQKIAQARLNKLLEPADPGEINLARARINVSQASIAAAQANLNARQVEYDELIKGISASSRAELQAEYARAQSAVDESRSNLETTEDIYRVTEAELDAAEARLAQAINAASAAQARLTAALDPPTPAEIAAAQHQIAQGEEALRQANATLIDYQNQLADLQEGANVEDIDIARSELEKARISYELALLNIENAQLMAPRDGVISSVNVRVGELFSGNTTAMVLADLQSYHMTVQVDEIDVRQVQMGQGVSLIMDALPDDNLSGKVTSISPTANEVGSTITYEVEIVPDPTDAPLREGMSATAIITTAQVDNVLLIPNRYVRFDRDKNKYFVFKVLNAEPVLAEIKIGLRNERESQILAGLTDTDEVALLNVDRERELMSAIFGG